MKELLLTSLDMIHICIFIYLSIGGYFIPKQYLPVYLLSLPYIIIDWNDRDKLCWMTKLRNMIHYEEIDPKPKEDIENNANVEITHINLNDDTVEGIKIKNKNCFSVQYHPESSPGPHDSRYLFDDFVNNIKNN